MLIPNVAPINRAFYKNTCKIHKQPVTYLPSHNPFPRNYLRLKLVPFVDVSSAPNPMTRTYAGCVPPTRARVDSSGIWFKRSTGIGGTGCIAAFYGSWRPRQVLGMNGYGWGNRGSNRLEPVVVQ